MAFSLKGFWLCVATCRGCHERALYDSAKQIQMWDTCFQSRGWGLPATLRAGPMLGRGSTLSSASFAPGRCMQPPFFTVKHTGTGSHVDVFVPWRSCSHCNLISQFNVSVEVIPYWIRFWNNTNLFVAQFSLLPISLPLTSFVVISTLVWVFSVLHFFANIRRQENINAPPACRQLARISVTLIQFRWSSS